MTVAYFFGTSFKIIICFGEVDVKATMWKIVPVLVLGLLPVVPDAFTHGTSAQRMYWFKKGYDTGDIQQGDTFNATDL